MREKHLPTSIPPKAIINDLIQSDRRPPRPAPYLCAVALIFTLLLCLPGNAAAQAGCESLGTGTTIPDPKASGPLTLEELLAYTATHAPALKVVEAQARSVDALEASAARPFNSNPILSGGAGARHTGGEAFFEVEIGIQQSFEVNGEQDTRKTLATASKQLAKTQIENTCWDIHQRLHAAFRTVLVLDAQLFLADELILSSKRLLGVAQRRVDEGEEAPINLLRLQADVADAQQRRTLIIRRRGEALTQLAFFAGWPIGAPLEIQGNLPTPRRTPTLKAMLTQAKAHNSGYQLQTQEIARAKADLALQEAEASVEPWIGLNYAREGGTPDAHIWMISAGIPLPLWDTNQTGQAAASAKILQSTAKQTQFAHKNAAEIAGLKLQIDTTLDQIDIYERDILPNFTRNLELIQHSYELGAVDLSDVTQTRERLLRMRVQSLDALEDYWKAVNALEAQVGGEIWPTNTTPRGERP